MIEGQLKLWQRILFIAAILLGGGSLIVEFRNSGLQRNEWWLPLLGLIITLLYVLELERVTKTLKLTSAQRRNIEIIGLFVDLVLIIRLLYVFDWSGFGTQFNPPFIEQSKTLWDWLQILIVPLLLAVGGAVLNVTLQRNEQDRAKRQAKTERTVAKNRSQDERLNNYLNKMSELLMEKGLAARTEPDEVTIVARARTATTVSGLSGMRKASVLNFLYESNLIGGKGTRAIIALAKVDFSGACLAYAYLAKVDLEEVNMRKANLTGAYLYKANLTDANLHDAKLEKANLQNADLVLANLQYAILIQAQLHGVNLLNANLHGANLTRVDLHETNLETVNLREVNLESANLQAANLGSANLQSANLQSADLENTNFDEDTTLPDGTKWTPDTDMTRFTDPNHPSFWRSDNPRSPAYRGAGAAPTTPPPEL